MARALLHAPTLSLPRKRERGRWLRVHGQISFRSTRREPSGALSRLRGRVGWGRATRRAANRLIPLRHILAGSARRRARAMRSGFAAGAAIPGIVRRRLQPGARSHAGVAAVDRGIEQFRQRRPDRLHVRPVCFGFQGFAGFFGGVGFLRHARNMGRVRRREKGKADAGGAALLRLFHCQQMSARGGDRRSPAY